MVYRKPQEWMKPLSNKTKSAKYKSLGPQKAADVAVMSMSPKLERYLECVILKFGYWR